MPSRLKEKIVPFTIRPGRGGEEDAIRAVFHDAVRPLTTGHYSRRQLDVWAGLSHSYDPRPAIQTGHLFVAEKNDRLAGFGALNVEKGELHMLYVRHTQVRRGIGRALTAALEELAASLRMPVLRLRASLNAVSFYTLCGYQPARTLTVRTPDGTPFKVVHMVKYLTLSADDTDDADERR